MTTKSEVISIRLPTSIKKQLKELYPNQQWAATIINAVNDAEKYIELTKNLTLKEKN